MKNILLFVLMFIGWTTVIYAQAPESVVCYWWMPAYAMTTITRLLLIGSLIGLLNRRLFPLVLESGINFLIFVLSTVVVSSLILHKGDTCYCENTKEIQMFVSGACITIALFLGGAIGFGFREVCYSILIRIGNLLYKKNHKHSED